MCPEGSVANVDRLVDVFHQFHFLTITKEVKSNHKNLSSHDYSSWMVTWADLWGGCYRLGLEHGSPIRQDGRWVLVMHARQFHVCLLHLHSMCLLHFLDVYHDGSKVFMRNLMIDFVECINMSIWLVAYGYMSLTCWLYVVWLHPCMLSAFLNVFITYINLVSWLQGLIAYALLHPFMCMCSWLGIAYACWWLHLVMCTMY